jgi:hypothetical protein
MARTLIHLVAVTFLSIGCGPKAQPSSATQSPFASVPQLPNPKAGSYARVIQSPTDPAVIAIIGDRRWDASLAGAAAGLALKSADKAGGFSAREIREAAWRAGYPYPIAHLAVWQAQPKTPPPADVRVWLSELSDEMDIGLVRARSGTQEIWVGLAAHPLVDLGVIPREASLQTPLKLPAIPGATLEVSSPLGVWTQLDLSTTQTLYLDSEGEWLLAITDSTGDLARFTLYAGTESPSDAIIIGAAIPVANAEAAKKAATDILADAREVYGLSPWDEDPYLMSTAATLFDASSIEADENTVEWKCTGRTVEDCVDQMLWIPAYRTTLLNPEAKYVGVASKINKSGVDLRVVIANE